MVFYHSGFLHQQTITMYMEYKMVRMYKPPTVTTDITWGSAQVRNLQNFRTARPLKIWNVNRFLLS